MLHQNPAHIPAANVPRAVCMNPICVTPATEEKRKRNNFIATPAKLVPQKPRNSYVTNVKPIPIMFIVTQCLIMSCCTLTVSLSTTKSQWPRGPGWSQGRSQRPVELPAWRLCAPQAPVAGTTTRTCVLSHPSPLRMLALIRCEVQLLMIFN